MNRITQLANISFESQYLLRIEKPLHKSLAIEILR